MIQTSAADLKMLEPGILLVRFRQGIGLELGHVPEVVSAARRLAGSTVHGNLVDVRELLYIEQEAREAFAAQQSARLSGIAILLNSPLHRILANVYLSVSRPKVPTRMFASEPDSLRWLRSMNDQASARTCWRTPRRDSC